MTVIPCRITYFEPQEEVSITFGDYSPEVGETVLIQASPLGGPVPSRSNPLEYTSLESLAKRALPTPRERVAAATRSTARRVIRRVAGTATYDERGLTKGRTASKAGRYTGKIRQSASVKRAGEKGLCQKGSEEVISKENCQEEW